MKITNAFKVILTTLFIALVLFIPNTVNAQEPGDLSQSGTTGIYHCTDGVEGNWSILDSSCNAGYMPDVSICYEACLTVALGITGNTSIGDAEITACRSGNMNSVTVGCITDPDYVPPNEGPFGTGSGAENVTAGDFDALNPLKVARKTEDVTVEQDLSTPGGIISRLLEFAFPLAGLILFVMLFWGGFEITYGASTSKSMEAGKNRITAALIGFFLLFASFWIIQILQEILGIESFLS
ncbi:MAG: pilin [Candidatus Pacebacteria bacterium]|nr:pilin [Candidatus Paceibacterota bacterium]